MKKVSVLDDARLLAELDAEIKKQEASLDNKAAGAVLNAFLPAAKTLLPLAQQETTRKVDLMKRVYNRLSTLMDAAHE